MRWVTDGIDRCTVGHVGEKYAHLLDHLDGRLAQVVEIFSQSRSASKIAYNAAKDGVVLAVIVDWFEPLDSTINGLLDSFDSDSEEE